MSAKTEDVMMVSRTHIQQIMDLVASVDDCDTACYCNDCIQAHRQLTKILRQVLIENIPATPGGEASGEE